MVRIYTVHYIKPEFLKLQHEQLQIYCQDDFEYVVINNALDEAVFIAILSLCYERRIECLNVVKNKDQQEFCSLSHARALEFALPIIREKKADINIIMDNDVFPFRPFSFFEIINGNKIAGIYQSRNGHTYTSAIFMLLDGSLDLTDFSFQSGIGDTGAAVQSLMVKYNVVPEWVNHTGQIDIEADYIFRGVTGFPYMKEYRSQFIADTFIHYYRGSNWQETSEKYHEQKFRFLCNFLSNPESYKIHLDEFVNYPFAHAEKSHEGVDHNYLNYRYNKIS